MSSTTISMASSYVAQKLGIKGYCLGISNACASGTSAIGEAYRLIRTGHAGLILCGGTEAPICRICIEGYGASGAFSRGNGASASRAFDRTRDGFVLSEGACVLVLEDYMSAVKRGVKIYGEITGYGNTTDAFHQTKPSSEGESRAISMAMDETELKPDDIDFINAHGTSRSKPAHGLTPLLPAPNGYSLLCRVVYEVAVLAPCRASVPYHRCFGRAFQTPGRETLQGN